LGAIAASRTRRRNGPSCSCAAAAGQRIEPTGQRFEEYAREWLARQEVRPRTKEKYTWALEQHLIRRLGRRRLDQISCDDVAALIAAMLGGVQEARLPRTSGMLGEELLDCRPPRGSSWC